MTKAELQAYRHIVRELEILDRERAYWYAQAERCVRAPGRPPVAGGEHDPYPAIFDKLTEIGDTAQPLVVQLRDKRKRIEASLSVLSPLERTLIRARYIEGKRWEQIAVDTGYCIQHVWRLHGIALRKLERQ